MINKIRSVISHPKLVLKIIKGIYYHVLFYSRYKRSGAQLKNAVLFDYDFGIYADFYINIYIELKKNQIPTYCLVNTLNYKWHIDKRFDIEDYIPTSSVRDFSNSLVIHATNPRDEIIVKTQGLKNIQINHGFGSFGSVFDEKFVKNIDYFFANTEHQIKQLYRGEVKNNIKPGNIFKVGLPKLDSAFEVAVERSGKRTFFYGPTYHKDISSVFTFLEVIVDYCTTNDILLFIKLHPFLYYKSDKEKSGGVDWKEKIKALENEKVVLVYNEISLDELYGLFQKTDVFLTDNSALGYEFVLATGKNIVYLGNKLKVPVHLSEKDCCKFKMCPEILYRNKIGPTIKDPKSFKGQMDDLLKNNFISYSYEIMDFRKNFTFNLGSSTLVAVKIIKDILNKTND